MNAHPLLRHDFCPLKRPRINLYFLLNVYVRVTCMCALRSALHDQVIQLSRAIRGISLKGVIEIRENLLSQPRSRLSWVVLGDPIVDTEFHSQISVTRDRRETSDVERSPRRFPKTNRHFAYYRLDLSKVEVFQQLSDCKYADYRYLQSGDDYYEVYTKKTLRIHLFKYDCHNKILMLFFIHAYKMVVVTVVLWKWLSLLLAMCV